MKEEANADSTVETEVPSLQRSLGAEAPGHQKVQPGAVEEQFEKKLEQLEDQLEEHAQDAAAHGEVEKVKETGGGGQAPVAVHEGQVRSSTIAESTHQLHVILQLYRASGQNYGSVMLAFVNIAFI